jgi:hypothetical protein
MLRKSSQLTNIASLLIEYVTKRIITLTQRETLDCLIGLLF